MADNPWKINGIMTNTPTWSVGGVAPTVENLLKAMEEAKRAMADAAKERERFFQEQRPFLRAIAAAPNPAPYRAEYADWLDDHGESLEAALQRVLMDPASDARRLEYAAVCDRLGTKTCPACSGEGCARRGYGDLTEECGGSGKIVTNKTLADRAEFVRIQVALANTDKIIAGHPGDDISRRADDAVEPLRAEAVRLYNRNYTTWTPDLPGLHKVLAGWAGAGVSSDGEMAGLNVRIRTEWWRGFIEELTLPWADCETHLDMIRNFTPVRKVTITTRPRLTAYAEYADRGRGLLYTVDGRVVEVADADVDSPTVWLPRRWPGVEFEVRVSLRWPADQEGGTNSAGTLPTSALRRAVEQDPGSFGVHLTSESQSIQATEFELVADPRTGDRPYAHMVCPCQAQPISASGFLEPGTDRPRAARQNTEWVQVTLVERRFVCPPPARPGSVVFRAFVGQCEACRRVYHTVPVAVGVQTNEQPRRP